VVPVGLTVPGDEDAADRGVEDVLGLEHHEPAT
jgi:hypothetical protein